MDAVRLDAAGNVLSERPVMRARNLLMDAGLDYVATNGWLSGFAYFGLATDPITLRRDSGVATVTRVGNTLTASASFFEAADVGRVVVLTGDAQEMRITGYTPGGTQVTVGGAARDVAAAHATVLYCNQTALSGAGPLARFATVATNTNANGASWNGTTGVLSTWVTRLSTAAAANTTYKAIGWFNAPTGGTMMGAVNINGGAGDVLLTGEQYRVKVQLDRKIGPLTPVDLGAAITGWAATITAQIEGIGYEVWSTVGTLSQPANFHTQLEPNATLGVQPFTQALALRAPTYGANVEWPTGSIGTSKNLTNASYVSGSFYRDASITFAVGDNNAANWRTIGFGNAGSAGKCAFRLLLSADMPKTTDDTLTLTIRRSWGRDLSEFL
ncbi:MAG TPA: hypothetical protein VK163_01255 [Opitutaceae bacterium]|nr:hypothetical protein [Opitutaceae bacterium]